MLANLPPIIALSLKRSVPCALCGKQTKITQPREVLRCVAVIAGRWALVEELGPKSLHAEPPAHFPGVTF